MVRASKQIEADIIAIKANPNWATDEASLIAIAGLTNQLTASSQSPAPTIEEWHEMFERSLLFTSVESSMMKRFRAEINAM